MNPRDDRNYFNFALPDASADTAPYVLHPRFSRGAVASLLLAIASALLVIFFIGYPLAIAAIVCGICGLFSVKRGGGRIKGMGFAIAGIAIAVLAFMGGIFLQPTAPEDPYQRPAMRTPARSAPAVPPAAKPAPARPSSP